MTTPELEEELRSRGIPGDDERKRSLLIEMLRDDDLSRHPPSPLVYIPHPETPEEIVESPQEIIDLTKYVDVPNREGMKASIELEEKTGPIPLRTFMNYFPPGISNINVNKYDIIQTDEYRDNGLYFVYGRNGTRCHPNAWQLFTPRAGTSDASKI